MNDEKAMAGTGQAHPKAWLMVAITEGLVLSASLALVLLRPFGEASLLPGLLLAILFLFYMPLLITPSHKWEELWLVRQLRKYGDRD
jgi:hypothetical protein